VGIALASRSGGSITRTIEEVETLNLTAPAVRRKHPNNPFLRAICT
jgi:hypothetical protein